MWTPDLKVFNRSATDHQNIAARDLFALGCYLTALGKSDANARVRDAGAKARSAALEGIGVTGDLLHGLVNDIQTDRAWIETHIAPHAEILALFQDASPGTRGAA